MVVEKNKVISLTYILRDEGNHIVEYSEMPVSYLHGSGTELFDKVEYALEGHEVGDRVVVTLPPKEGFGSHDPRLTYTDDVENVPPELRRVGSQFEAQNARGEAMQFIVKKIDDGKLTVDANHPLAGKTVTFEVTVQDIRDATPEELQNGKPASTFGPVK
jgi:FKBP-type peptidyl-prolyl cis-trans isomerase SlyD